MKLTDQDKMPFGEHKDAKMEEVPARYLLWLWDDGELWVPPPLHCRTSNRELVRKYIIENFEALETECPDRIITHRPVKS